jgi:DNA-binding NarL/FixJ family response regulator
MKTGASNRQVAEILESKKGTIDAHLSAIKAKWKQYDDETGKEIADDADSDVEDGVYKSVK